MTNLLAKPALRVDDVACFFDVSPSWFDRTVMRKPQRTLKAVDGLSFVIPRGTTFSIVGESGCGKSTLARLVVGLYQPTRGTLSFANGSGRDGLVRTQMIFQDPFASLNPRWRVGAIIAEPIKQMGLRPSGAETQTRVRQLLETVGLSGQDSNRYPHEFSGGQRQRISIARALAAEPEFLVCDEPTSALDVSVQAQILNLLKDLQRELGLTYLFISHNLAAVRHVSDRVAVMYLGRIVEEAATDEIFERPQHPYTRFLLDTVPNLDRPNRDRVPATVDLPSPIDPPPGCAYNPRCPLATDTCRTDAPESRPVGGTLVRCHHATL
ncbi:ATP-binding cassette domain-containing protein [Mesorhizobium sp. M8A.F.Ca.ET.207.01.1.1]|uniref:ABC transporter ATP-binding protein n=3 Tax=unclassified Mesorhizobium TaxID=325217 RepID=UPI00109D464B|nr:oligopeptide/dipeptide ABC transporter ATP-binding protein [Mesorhizobium sp. M8A.F.Ca.ET.207.01.1.1]TGQ77074.1 ATP-binding cassette domain-containing protein [Mesorhizobium sp. M8A.F.Ca.ET.207.01.1.1]